MDHTKFKAVSQKGYGLVVVAALMTAFAVIAAAALDRNTANQIVTQQRAVKDQLSRLSIALTRYAHYNGQRFPCPASEQLAPDNASFGAAASATCFSGAAPAGTATIDASSKLIRGMVPVRELAPYGVSDADAFDPWGARIIYIVHRDLTRSAPLVVIPDSERVSVTEYNSGETISPRPDLILISFGPDRLGGRLRGQTDLSSPAVACPAGTNRRSHNCDHYNGNDTSFTIGPMLTGGQTALANYFDDTLSLLRYR